MRGKVVSSIRPGFPGLSQSQGQVTHVLLTRSPLIRPASGTSSFDLHVLSTPPAFVLSQDQTLRQKNNENIVNPGRKHHHPPHGGGARAAANSTKQKIWYQQTWHTIEFSNNRPATGTHAPETVSKLCQPVRTFFVLPRVDLFSLSLFPSFPESSSRRSHGGQLVRRSWIGSAGSGAASSNDLSSCPKQLIQRTRAAPVPQAASHRTAVLGHEVRGGSVRRIRRCRPGRSLASLAATALL